MRTEKEIFDLLLHFAKSKPEIRAVGMEGSRTNPNVPKDIFQDYDISYFVTDMNLFIKDEEWINIFGDRIIMQKPEAMSLFPPELGGWFSYLMLFDDGNRIDLKLVPVNDADKYTEGDKLIKILLDKDGIFPSLPEPSDEDYHIKRPSKEFFDDCCNEFWWVSTYVAKGLWRKEILYANNHINLYVRPSLLRMLQWKAGIGTDFSKSVGKNNKYLSLFISQTEWNLLLSTYKNSNPKDCWQSLFTLTELFRDTALFVAQKLGYIYPVEDDNKVTKYLKRVKELPDNADTIFS
ncbi:aminoglycoside 6-adenylyltransferase [Dysgonomonas sp. 521]|uniref:aminoglycoside 6-adenylyltransferase n=1 Tax=Dysgonomonas sp. 521 TaxID=2302932 RepID=UPI0013D29B23|nr:aminoglycoside 6-adenylyltransferase [Dysgonomonas sp. 521]NDV97085.1 aminoglycoside 6-adenylyltransferase [Dysgonomonas sp. 521]